MPKSKKKPFKITLKQAKELIKKELKLPTTGLKRDVDGHDDNYIMNIGALEIEVGECFYVNRLGKELIQLRVGSGKAFSSESFWMLYDPETLKRDYAREEKLKKYYEEEE
ncbi:MAG: hypothetical protein QM689_12575 [Oscillospiraceae bacterium]